MFVKYFQDYLQMSRNPKYNVKTYAENIKIPVFKC